MANTYGRGTPEQVAQLRAKYQAQQSAFSSQYNPSGIPTPGPGFYAPPFYVTDDGAQYLLARNGQWTPQPFIMPGPFELPGGGANPTGPSRTAFPQPTQPWTSGGNSNPVPPTYGGSNPTMPTTPNNNAGSSGFNWQSAIGPAAAALIPILMNQFGGNGGGNSPSGGNANLGGGINGTLNALTPEMIAMFRHQQQRQQMLDPLFSDVVGMTQRRLPTWARGSGPAMPSSGTSAAVAPTTPGVMPGAGSTMPPGAAPRTMPPGTVPIGRAVPRNPSVERPTWQRPAEPMPPSRLMGSSAPAGDAPVDLQALVKILQAIRPQGGVA